MESILTKTDAGRLLTEYSMPLLKEGEYAAGIRSACEVMCRQAAEAQGKSITDISKVQQGKGKI